MKDLHSTVLVLMIVLGVTHTSPTENYRKKSGEGCRVHGRLYGDNEMFSIPDQSRCLRYRCNNGEYTLVEEGCEFNDVCKPLGAEYTHECLDYRCTKTPMNNHFAYFSAIIKTACRDFKGGCHKVDANHFYEDKQDGNEYPRCYCDGSVQRGQSICY
ncbi:unnamed protein product [Lymnaea stagnalis]|uniref:Uncharacterized protein n=1 Tax=Lymnaea stagnalis TaxID=6523 RepID=A0AAV2HH55_LYMST